MHQQDIVQILKEICSRRNISLTTYSDDWVIKITDGIRVHWIFGQSFDLNSQANAAIAVDKVASSMLLGERQIPHVSHKLLSREVKRTHDLTAIRTALDNGTIVMKPLRGHGGKLVTKIETLEQAEILIRSHPDTTWAYSPLKNIESEVRFVVLDGKVELAFEKMNPYIKGGLKLFNLSQGASAVSLNSNGISAEITCLAVDAMRALGLRIAAIDIIRTTDGTLEVLEANAIFSLMRYAKINDATYGEVASFYDRLVAKLFTQ